MCYKLKNKRIQKLFCETNGISFQKSRYFLKIFPFSFNRCYSDIFFYLSLSLESPLDIC